MTDIKIIEDGEIVADELDGSIDVSGSVILPEDEANEIVTALEDGDMETLMEYRLHDNPAIVNLVEEFGLTLQDLNADVETDETGSVMSINSQESETTRTPSDKTSDYKVTENLE